ncbi:uncharacterized protein BYT42DRAFT_595024 [Radiomyces spectabilis]|uniref:uncharacterized protein n=1 Tax=Radiomyces spectabilis TaxID=64574 RepID=UPI00221FF19E|nr:uncharacterized protein BYT42DRAFT_595024 [Radiomyces spectabilis]KAI8371498.1 hypothetical protein BYT42DRAFT_595024 [Radiomyces spectabilis]
MRKNARFSGMGVGGLHMGNLGLSMGLRTGPYNANDNIEETNPLMKGFYDLREYLTTVEGEATFLYSLGGLSPYSFIDVRELDAIKLLNPFFEVIRSGNTTGPIAGAALGSIEKFLQYGIVGLHNPSIAFAMNALSSASAHCKFEASDAASDELVLLKMLQVLQTALTSECGQVLSDAAVCGMMETGLTMCCQLRLSEMLRRSAEHAMSKIVIAIFERLKDLEEEWQIVDVPNDVEKANPASSIAPHMSPPRPSDSPQTTSSSEKIVSTMAVAAPSTPNENEKGTQPTQQDATNTTSSPTAAEEASPTEEKENGVSDEHVDELNNLIFALDDQTPLKPYGLPAIQELLRVLISLLNPHEHKHTDSMRMMALSILNVAFEVAGRSISRFDILRSLVTDDLCKYLFQLAKTNSTPLLALTLRTITTVIDTTRPHLKLQQELFLFFLIERLTLSTGGANTGVMADLDEDGSIGFVPFNRDTALEQRNGHHNDVRSVSPNMFLGKTTDYPRTGKGYPDHTVLSTEVRELLLECLLQCARNPTFMVDLWYNYDCDLTCGDLFEELIQFLSRNSFPDNTYSSSNTHVLCLDALLMFIDHIVDRVNNEEYTSSEELLRRKASKRLILQGSYLFNESPKKGIKFLEENGVIKPYKNDDDESRKSLANFLRSTQQLNKKSLGEYLGRPENFDLLQVFMRQFEFTGKRMDEALRAVLETFRLPGESQQIIRVTDTFADVYFETKPEEIANSESAQILAYSIIMLNTDQHNPQVRRRMTLEDYMRNLRGVNGGQDFPKEHLKHIYEAISKDEIVMPEEHEGRLGFNYAWKQLLHRANVAGPFTICNTSAYDKAVFELAWKPTVAAIFYAFTTAQDDITLQKAISGFHHCAMLAAHFELYQVFDSIVINLAKMTGLLEKSKHNHSLPDPIVNVEGQEYVVSELAVQFGRDYKGQLAAVVIFTIVTRHGNALRKGWTKILEIIRNLFLNSLLPTSMLQVEDFLSGTTSIPLKPKTPVAPKQPNRRDGSLLSALSSYLLSPYSHDESYRADPTEEEVVSTMCAVDCIVACRLEELFTDISNLKIEPLQSLMEAIIAVGYDPKIAAEMTKATETTETTTTTPATATPTIPYDPATILFLELMITVTIRNSDRIDDLW